SRPRRSTVACCGTRRSERVSTVPPKAALRCWAVRQTVSPSGIETQPLDMGLEAGGGERRADGGARDGLPVGGLHREPPPAQGPRAPDEALGGGLQAAGLVRERQQ